MKSSWVLLAGLLLATSCATVQENVDARKLLARCEFEYAGVKLDDIQLSSKFVPEAVELTVKVKIHNPNAKPVAVDHLTLVLSAKGREVLDAKHKRFVQIDPDDTVVEPLSLKVPFSGALAFTGKRPEVLEADAKVWLTILMGGKAWETPIVVPVHFEIPIPWDDIDKAVAKKTKELKDKAADSVKKLLKTGKP